MITAPTGWEEFSLGSSAYQIKISVWLKNSVHFDLYTENIDMGSLSIDDDISNPGEFIPGAVISQVLHFTIINDANTFGNIDFTDAGMHVQFFISDAPSDLADYVWRGYFYVESAEKNGSKISITAYDCIGFFDDVLPDGYETASTAKLALSDLVEYAPSHGTVFNWNNMPNADYAIGQLTVGTDLSSGITRRELIQYICEICGCYVRCHIVNEMAEVIARGLPKYDYTDNLDGGDFTFEGSPSVPAVVGNVVVGEFIVGTETTEDDADGGLFLAPIAQNHTEITQDNWTESGTGWSFLCNGVDNEVGYLYSNYTSSDVPVVVNEAMTLPIGMYQFAVSNIPSSVTSIVLKNTTQNIEYTATLKGITFYNNSEGDEYTITFNMKKNTNTAIGQVLVYLTDNAWLGASAFQNVWQQTEAYDGGFFGFWGITNPTVYPIPNLVYFPQASERKSITKVVVSGSFDTVEVGSDEGETYEISNNPLISDETMALAVATQVLSTLAGVTYHKFDATWAGDPRYEPGDMVSFTDINGNSVTTPCSGFRYRHGQFFLQHFLCRVGGNNGNPDEKRSIH